MAAKTPRETSVNLAVNLGGLTMKNPVTTASGTFAAGMEYSDFVDVSALGAVTTKGVSLNGWEGNASPRIAEVPSGMLNSIGLQNPGVAHLKSEELPWLRQCVKEITATNIGARHSLLGLLRSDTPPAELLPPPVAKGRQKKRKVPER